MKINIETIPHKDQRYQTVGDYWIDEDGTIQVRVSEMGTDIYEQMVAVHELVELLMCLYKKIPFEEIDKFDMDFERTRKSVDPSEPGFDQRAPYKNEHAIATAVELVMCAHLGIAWQDYENKVNSL